MTDNIREELEAAYQASMDNTPESTPEPAAETSPDVESEPVDQELAAAPAEEVPRESQARSSGEQVTLEQATGRDPQGRYTSTKKAPPPVVTVKPTPSAQATAQKAPAPGAAAVKPTVPGAPAPEQQPAVDVRPPQSLKPAEREAFKKWPRDAQEALVRREKELVGEIQRKAAPAKFGQEIAEAIRPFEQSIRAMGGNPVSVIGNLLQTSHALQYSSPHQRAEVFHSLLQQFPPDIDALNARLEGKGIPQGGQPAQSQGFDPAQFDQMLRSRGYVTREDLQQQQQERRVQQAHRAVAEFSEKAEFWPDVEHLVGTLLQASAARRSPLTLEQAYDLACKSTPEVSQVLEQRARHQQANAVNASTQRAKAAAATIRSGSPGPAQEARPQGTDDIRADLEAAMLAVSRR